MTRITARGKQTSRSTRKAACFVSSEGEAGEEEIVILNEARDATSILPKIAALALYGQPFGFTRADVRNLRVLAVNMEQVHLAGQPLRERFNVPTTPLPDRPWWSDDLADRIEALLPPEKK